MQTIHKTAEVSFKSRIGKNTKIWNHSQVRENAKIGDNCILGKNVYIDHDVSIGKNVKIQNNSSIYFGTTIKDGVFVGPHVVFANDKVPRAIDSNNKPKGANDWKVGMTVVEKGASIGAHSVILPDVKIGSFAMVGSGSVVTKDVPNQALVFGNPAEIKGFVCACGNRLSLAKKGNNYAEMKCASCKKNSKIKISDFKKWQSH